MAGEDKRLKEQPSRAALPARGFTLVELLVVIAIIGILVALLLPAIQSAREAARRAQCQSNIKNVALAVHSYESANKTTPNGMRYDEKSFAATVHRLTVFEPNWIIRILPYLEEQPLYDSFDFKQRINLTSPTDATNVNRTARGTEITVLLCPSDQFNRVRYDGALPSHGDNWARTNYAGNAGGADIYPGASSNRATGPQSAGWVNNRKRGIMGPNASVPFRRITDGLSKTALIGEIRAGVTNKDSRGVWAMGHAGPSLLAGYGSDGDDNGPNACNARADDVYFETQSGGCESTAMKSYLQSICMTCDAPGNYFAQATMRSAHVGGVFAALCDGSVRFISDDIETSGQFGEWGTPWDYLIASGDEEEPGPYGG